MLEVTALSKTFAGFKAVNQANLAVEKGEIVAVIGPNGAGKTTLFNLITGIIKPDSGRVWINGKDSSRFTPQEWRENRKQFGMLFQDAALFDSMNVFENVAFPLVEHSKKSKEEIAAVVAAKLNMVGLVNAEHKSVADLSGGMRKRVGLARAIALDPAIVLFDEPTSGLDPIVTTVVDHLILDTQKQTGCTYVVISHDINAVFRIADRIAMLYEGRIVIDATRDEVKHSKDPLVRQFVTGSLEGPFDVYY